MSCSRREFMKSVVGASTIVSLSPAVPLFVRKALHAAPADVNATDTVLVVVQLSGGNDGLNTVVPFEDDVYGRSRKTLRLTAREVHPIDDQLGFHPEMQRSLDLFREGHLSVVQGVGYPQSDRDHEVAMRDWYTARPGQTACPTGWIGRTVDSIRSTMDVKVPAAFVAPIPKPLALNAEKSIIPRIITAESWTRNPTPGETSGKVNRAPLASSEGPAQGQPLLSLVRRATSSAYTTSGQVKQVLNHAVESSPYPAFPFAQRLKAIAELVKADVGTRIYFTELGGGGFGGFDNHANQRDNHAALLRQLSGALAAFVADLRRKRILDRVALMTFSEFGRTVSENGRRGTGHGAAAPVLLAGGKLKGGLIGHHPDLLDLDADAPKFHTDFRQVYATMLENWLGFRSESALGQKFQTLDLFA
ncbi:MAG: DUF1501 domain-containing protein [Pirellulaceae bacterium]